MDAAKYRDVTAPELCYLQLTAADFAPPLSAGLTGEGKPSGMRARRYKNLPPPAAFLPLLLQTLSPSRPDMSINVGLGEIWEAAGRYPWV